MGSFGKSFWSLWLCNCRHFFMLYKLRFVFSCTCFACFILIYIYSLLSSMISHLMQKNSILNSRCNPIMFVFFFLLYLKFEVHCNAEAMLLISICQHIIVVMWFFFHLWCGWTLQSWLFLLQTWILLLCYFAILIKVSYNGVPALHKTLLILLTRVCLCVEGAFAYTVSHTSVTHFT